MPQRIGNACEQAVLSCRLLVAALVCVDAGATRIGIHRRAVQAVRVQCHRLELILNPTCVGIGAVRVVAVSQPPTT